MFLFVTRETGPLERQVWQFDLLYNYADAAVVVDYYAVERRTSGRAKWRPVADTEYKRRARREQSTIPASAVPLPGDVINEAQAQLLQQLPILVEADRSK